MIEAMKQALEALELGESKLRFEAITALRAAIESQERVMKLRQDIAHHLALADGINAELAMQRLTDVQQEMEHSEDVLEMVEPVAWVEVWDDYAKKYALEKVNPDTPLYSHPPRREWVSLTDEEIEDCWDGYLSDYQLEMIRAIETTLKEKNGG
jgi:hypothetical protein